MDLQEITRPPTGPPVAEVKGLCVDFTRAGSVVHALRGVDLEIGPGEIVALVGESGSGKSVLSLALLGLLPAGRTAPRGEVRVRGVDMLGADAEQRRRARRLYLGAVFQDPMTSLDPTMRIGKQLAETAGSSGEAVRLLDLAGVPDPRGRLRAFPHELSGGLRQRVMIAMAVAGDPPLVVADEPTTALDVTVQAQILRLLERLRSELGTSFLLVTHDLAVAATVANRVAVLYGGRIAEVGPISLLAASSHPYTRGLLATRLEPGVARAGVLRSLPGEPLDARTELVGCPFAARCHLVTDACRSTVPVPVEIGPGHRSACLRHAELGDIDVEKPATTTSITPMSSASQPVTPGSDRPASCTPALRLVGARRTFRLGHGRRAQHLQALQGIDLTVAEGESVAIVGESGCGKSTLLRVIAGLTKLDEGNVELGPGAGPQMVFQDAGASLTPWLTVGELLQDRLRVAGVAGPKRQERVRAALINVGLPAESATVRANQLSGGQRQRVALARATIVPPSLLLCDEPTSALDVSLAATVLNLLARLRTELDMAMVFVTHDLAVAQAVADRIAVMSLGRIVEIGPAQQVIREPTHTYTKELLASVPSLQHRPIAVEAEPANAR
jgi:peptide/nickel transport system ATP-binding protein